MRRIELNPAALLVWLLLRGLYIWLLIALGALAGVCAYPLMMRRDITISQIITWLDLNAMAMLFHTLFRPLKNSTQVPWVRLKDLPDISHRFTDFTSL